MRSETPPDVSELEARVARLEARESERSTRARRRLRLLVVASLLAVVVAPLALAANGNCPNGLPFCFEADRPALASEVNTNFAQLKEWLELKVGPVDGGTVTGSSATFSGAATITGQTIVGSLSSAGQATVGALSVQGTSQLNGDVTLSPTARVRIQATGWCDCEFNAQVTSRAGAVVASSVNDFFLFENGQVGFFECRGGRFLVGIEKTSAGCLASVGCLEQYKCCRPCNFTRE